MTPAYPIPDARPTVTIHEPTKPEIKTVTPPEANAEAETETETIVVNSAVTKAKADTTTVTSHCSAGRSKMCFCVECLTKK